MLSLAPLTLNLVLHSHVDGRSGENTIHDEPCDIISVIPDYIQQPSMLTADAISPAVISSPPTWGTNASSPWLSPFYASRRVLQNGPPFATEVYQDFTVSQMDQALEEVTVPRITPMPKRKGRRHRALAYRASVSEHLPHVTPMQTASPGLARPANQFPCTAIGCDQSFKNASGWKRHEAGVHGYNDREWICMLTEAFKLQSECVFCLESMDSIDHLDKHAIDPCSNKCTAERSFPRKDLLKQHVLLAHLASASPSIRRTFEVPTEWERGLGVSPGGPGSRWCGFCRCMLETTAKRMHHVAQHFRKNQDMTSWIRM